MFRYRQSSDWFRRYGSRRLRYTSRPTGMRCKAAVSLDTSGKRCGQTGPGVSANRTPSHGDGVRVGPNRLEPMGGVAYGTPRNVSTVPGGREADGFAASTVRTTPCSLPYRVCTTRVSVAADAVVHNTAVTTVKVITNAAVAAPVVVEVVTEVVVVVVVVFLIVLVTVDDIVGVEVVAVVDLPLIGHLFGGGADHRECPSRWPASSDDEVRWWSPDAASAVLSST